MKSLLIASVFCSSLIAQAANAPEGKFSWAHEILFRSYANAEACKADQGRWEEDAGCIFAASDDVEVKKEGDALAVSVNTVTTNAHECSFEGKGVLQANGQILAEEATEDSSGKPTPVVCRLALTYGADDSLNVAVVGDLEACRYFCGMNAGLNIEKAVRVSAQ